MPKTRVTHDDDELVLRDVLARDAARAAGMLDTAAAVLLAVVTLLAVAGVAVGLGVLAVAHTSTGRIDAAITIAGSAVGLAVLDLPVSRGACGRQLHQIPDSTLTTASMIATVLPMRQVQLRVDEQLLDRIDERAAKVGLSRNAWIVKALAWAVEQPIRTIKIEEQL